MQSETSTLLGGGHQHEKQDEIFGELSRQAASRSKIVISLLAMAAIAGILTFHSKNPSSALPAIDQHNAALNWDEVHYAWETKLYEHGKKQFGSLDSLHSLTKVEGGGKLDQLLYLNNTLAFDMLKTDGEDSSALDFYYYQQGWEAQINQAYCPIASSAAIFNSLRGKVNLPQDEAYVPFLWATQKQLLLNDCVKEKVYNVDVWQHVFMGMTLDLTQQLLKCHLEEQGYTVEAHYVDPQKTTVKELRKAIKEAVIDTEARVMINYDRGGISQGEMGHGHFSPIGAYNHEIDAFLVLDVAKYKYPPVWGKCRLFCSMFTL